jgi:hypothetical protein
MVDSRLAASFWSAVKDCLITFHHFPPGDAAEKVDEFAMALSRAPLPATEGDFVDMVYHSEPWHIACNLAQSDLPLLENSQAYQEILSRNGLSTERPYRIEALPYAVRQSPLISR